jgi:D-alanyl-lipoteichoic acid acyltransferase DltB (MBOAT superfamily)
MTIGGIWHGAEWHYVTWGAFSGCVLVVVHEYERIMQGIPWLRRFHESKVSTPFAIALTFLTTLVCWAQFRALTVTGSVQMLQHMFTWKPSTGEIIATLETTPAVVALAVYMVYALVVAGVRRMPAVRSMEVGFLPRFAVCAAVFIASAGCQPTHLERFIYFQF